MKKLIIIMLLLIPSLGHAWVYQVSCDLTFTDYNRAEAVYRYLEERGSVAYICHIPNDSDCLWPDPNIILADPNYDFSNFTKIKCKFRVKQESIRDEIYNYLRFNKDTIDLLTHGQIEKHDCGGENPSMPCKNQVVDSWGGGEE